MVERPVALLKDVIRLHKVVVSAARMVKGPVVLLKDVIILHEVVE